MTVLDEADLMADMGFLPRCGACSTSPAGTSTAFPATLDGDVDRLVKDYLNDPVTHSVNSDELAPAEHLVFLVTKENRLKVLAELVPGRAAPGFARTKHGAARLAKELTRSGVPASELHGDLS